MGNGFEDRGGLEVQLRSTGGKERLAVQRDQDIAFPRDADGRDLGIAAQVFLEPLVNGAQVPVSRDERRTDGRGAAQHVRGFAGAEDVL
jgi:hypothetical protein